MGELGVVTLTLWGALVEASWVLVRVSAFVVTAPLLGARGAPGRVRLLLAVVLTPLIALTVPPVEPPALFSSTWWLMMMINVAVGLMLGLLLQLLFEALMLAAEMISALAGLSFAQVNDPMRGTLSPVLGSMLMTFTSLLFLAMDGHHALIRLLWLSFTAIPMAGEWSGPPWMALVGLLVPMLEAGISLALPVLASLLTVQLGFGLVSRAAPALNLFAIGLPAALLALLFLLWMWIPQIGGPLSQYWVEMVEAIGTAMQSQP